MLKINDIYQGWKVLDIKILSDYKSTGIWLRHISSNMEIFHLLNDEEENLFSFGFKTLPKDSTGIPHIIEHSVLAGSKHYPLKDPFIQLCNQSVKTFLNAMTYPDKTVYPASSISEADYFNLMAVYGDAVFFPLLTKNTFEQEGYHVEIDDKNKLSIQGVVYNEMKGAFSEFNSVVFSEVNKTLWPNTVYAVESGGDPANIPQLTYDDFKTFHKKYYSPSNCRLFLYGNISTEKQIDFINQKFLNEFLTNNVNLDDVDNLKETTRNEVSYNLKPIKQTVYSTVKGPSGENDKGACVVISWHLGDTSDTVNVMQSTFLAELLMGNDSSPLAKALIDSKLGDDIFPWRSCDLDEKWICMGVGLRGVKIENTKKIEKIVFETLSKLVTDGIPEEFIDSTIMAVDFEHREVTRSYGPYALQLMDKVYRGWMNGVDPFSSLFTREAFEQIKQNLKKDSKYIQNLIKKMLIENKHRACITVIPDKSYTDEMNAKEQKNIDSLISNMSEVDKTTYFEKVRKNQKKLKDAQLKEESEENRLLIPHLYPSQLKSTVDTITTTQTKIGDVPLIVHNQATNGIVYVTVAVPVDVLEVKDYPYLPLYSFLLTNTGCNGKTWAETEASSARVLGGLSAKPFVASIAPTPNAIELSHGKNKDIMGRHWIFVNLKMLEEKSEDALQVLFDFLDTADFTDITRLKDILLKLRNSLDNSVVPAGHQFVLSRTGCTSSRTKAVDEIWNGLSQLLFLHTLADSDLREVAVRLQSIQKKLQNSGMLLNITADDSGLTTVQPFLEHFLKGRKAPILAKKHSDQDFYALTFIKGITQESTGSFSSVSYTPRYIVPSQVGFAASCLPASAYNTKESIGENLLAHWLSNTVLYEKIRTVGGAYGAGAGADSFNQIFTFYTYRDPDPDKSINVFLKSLDEAIQAKLDKTEMERIITGCYSKLVQPRSPSANGFTGFIRLLYGISDEDRQQNLKTILSATADDLHLAAQRIKLKSNAVQSAIISGKNLSYTGNNIILPV
ncbi:MAG: hypothetical protein BKP49_11190 [Treponema sp. CETP13]|nr:MAG: hypothetical protein BKP49_11190 [Treponema sp. CETP13]